MNFDPRILEKIKKYCAFQERSQQEVRDKLYELGLHRNEIEALIAHLITENFLNEERFAIAFAGGRFRMKAWGRLKIKKALQHKRVSEYCIQKALREISPGDYRMALDKIIAGKNQSVKESNPLRKNYKVAQYAISRGFEPELVWNILRER